MLSDPTVHLVVEAGSSRLVGVHRRRFVRKLEGRGRILGAQLHPGAILGFVDRPASQWTDRIVALREVLDLDVAAVERAALACADDPGAFEVISAALLSIARPLHPHARLARTIVEHVTHTPGLVRVSELEARFRLDERVLQRLMQRYVGATPKWVISRVRLQEAAGLIELDPTRSLAQLADELGYADQAHFARDFSRVVGVPPRKFADRLRAASR